MHSPVNRYFSRVKYPDYKAFATHVEQEAKKIQGRKKGSGRKPRPLTNFEQLVLKLAHKHRFGLQINPKKITLELENHPEMAQLSEAQRRNNIRSIVHKLRRRGLVQTSLIRTPKLRKAAKEEIEKHMQVVENTLKKGRYRLGNTWRRHFSIHEARSIAIDGLVKGLETFNPTISVNKKAHLWRAISSVLADAVRKKIRAQYREGKMPAVEPLDHRAEKTPNSLEAMQRIYQLYTSGLLRKDEAAILAWRTVHSKNGKAIAKHLGITESRICQIVKQARVKLESYSSVQAE